MAMNYVLKTGEEHLLPQAGSPKVSHLCDQHMHCGVAQARV